MRHYKRSNAWLFGWIVPDHILEKDMVPLRPIICPTVHFGESEIIQL